MSASKRYRTSFIVEGTSVFPIDMLRYDSCFPADEASSNQIASTSREVPLLVYTVPSFGEQTTPTVVEQATPILNQTSSTGLTGQQVNLIRYHHDREPGLTNARWESFGWRVVGIIETIRL